MDAAADREALLRRAFLLPDCPSFGKLTLRPFSLWTLDLCEEFGLEFFVKSQSGEASRDSRLFQVTTLVWFHDQAHAVEDVDRSLMDGTWRAQVEAYKRNRDFAANLGAIVNYIAFFSSMVSAASVKVKKKPRSPGEKVDKDPAWIVEPGNTYALIWTITSGHIASREQEDYLYRWLPLPRLLQYYHCALREALVWTAKTGPRDCGADRKRLQAAAEAREKLAEKTRSASAAPDYF